VNIKETISDIMELIDIISTILVIGGALLILVVAICYLLSRMKEDPLPEDFSVNYFNPSLPKKGKKEVAPKTGSYSTPQPIQGPRIFPISKFGNEEIKAIRKIQVKETLTGRRSSYTSGNKTNGSVPRFTIVNDEIKKFNDRAVGD